MTLIFFDLQRFVNIGNRKSNTVVSGKESADYLENVGSNVQIYGYGGNDTIKSSKGSEVTIDGGAGNDSINITPTTKNPKFFFVSLYSLFISAKIFQGF
ncbi:MAG: hypothetical protein IK062_04195 [Selenomonadaceae bacterium]|nr:hypothetical protein [Selenomonadaceae bacterium]